jgi:major membrane immunogen (membrane-anchored lipoprotein)
LKKVILSLTLSFSALLLFACQSQDKEMTILDDISSISISESDGYGGINENYVTTVDKDSIISRLEVAFKNAKGRKQKVDVDTEKPDYDILIRYENGETHGLHLVLGNTGEKSSVMYVGHENNSFDISPEGTKVLRSVLDNQ